MSSKATIVITSAVAWSGTLARAQHMAMGLADRGWNVLFVDGPITFLSPLKNRELRPRIAPQPMVRELRAASETSGFLRILSPVASLPFGNMWRVINRFNQRVLAEQIGRSAAGPYVLLPLLPGSVDLVPYLKPVATLYDCADLHAEFPGFLRREVVYEMERALTTLSRTVFATASALQERLQAWHADVRLVPNGVGAEHFAKTPDLDEHPLLADIPRPRVGYIGGIGNWVDQSLIGHMADQRPDVHFVMIGPVETDVSALRRRSNVHFLGLQPYAELPRFLAGFDVALHAFVQNELTASVNPVKIYEYIASGREIIATTSRELQKVTDYVWLIDTPEAGLDALQRILTGDCRSDDAKRKAFIAEQTWTKRIDQIHHALLSAVPAHMHPHAALI